jgi:hypothetical protein
VGFFHRRGPPERNPFPVFSSTQQPWTVTHGHKEEKKKKNGMVGSEGSPPPWNSCSWRVPAVVVVVVVAVNKERSKCRVLCVLQS